MNPFGIPTLKHRLALLTAVTTLLTIFAMYMGHNPVQESNYWSKVKGQATQLYDEFFEENTNLRGYLLTRDQSFLTSLVTGEKEFGFVIHRRCKL